MTEYFTTIPTKQEVKEITDFPGFFISKLGMMYRYIEGKGYCRIYSHKHHNGYKRFYAEVDGKPQALYVKSVIAFMWSNNKASYVMSTPPDKKHEMGNKVIQEDLSGNTVKVWNSAKAIHNALGYDYGLICEATKRYPFVYKNYLWKRDDPR